MRELHIYQLGRVAYGPTHALQEKLQEARIAGDVPDTLLLLEHDPVITFGRGAQHANLLATPEVLAARGVECHSVGRGGDVTYHGPGQLVGYPIVDLRPDRQDVRKYVAALEEIMIRVAARHGLLADRIAGLNGTWIQDRKLGAVGVRIRKWVTMHGFALNANTELQAFDLIVPCGIPDKQVTSLARELGREVDLSAVARETGEDAATVLGARPVWRTDSP